MTNKEFDEVVNILVDLQKEFSGEEDRLKDISDSHLYKIEELDQQISNYRKNEDIDFRVFSPRNVSATSSEKILSLENEKNELEREKREADRQLSYYSGKAEKISKVLFLLKKEEGSEENSEEAGDNSKVYDTEEFDMDFFFPKKKKVFPFLDEETEEDLFENDESLTEEDSLEEQEASAPEESDNDSCGNVPVEEIEKVCHKVEFTEKIVNNDHIRAKLELKTIISELKELIRVYK